MEKRQNFNQTIKKNFFTNVSLGMLSMMGTSLFILADTVFIANGVGADGIAALNIVLPMVNIFNGLGWMLGVGGATLYSIEKGRRNIEKGNKQFTFTLLLSLVIAGLFTLGTLLFSDTILNFLGASGHIFGLSKSYYSVIMLFTPLFILNNVYITFLRNDHNPKLAMAALLIGGLMNIILDYIFIFPLNMGMRGAALATAVSPAVSLLICSLHLKNKERKLKFAPLSLRWENITRIFSIGFPSFLNEFSSAVVMFLFNIVLLRLIGNIGVSAYAIIANMNIIAIALFTGVGQGFQPLVSGFHGANQREEMKKVLKYALITTGVLGIAFFVIAILFAEPIISVFNNEANQQLVQLAVPGLILYFSSFLFTGTNFTAIYYMSAVERPRPSLIISLLRGLLLIFPVLFGMTNWLGVTGVWLTMLVVELLTLGVSMYALWIYQKRYLQTN